MSLLIYNKMHIIKIYIEYMTTSDTCLSLSLRKDKFYIINTIN